MIQQTSLLAYKNPSLTLGKRQEMVFAKLKELGSATNKDLAFALNWPINCVTPRVLELRNKGLVYDIGISDDKRPSLVWAIK